MNKWRWVVAAVLMIMTSWLAAGCGKSASPGSTPSASNSEKAPITIRWVSFRPANHSGVKSLQKNFLDKITQKTNGRVVFELKGGPEVMSPSDLGLAVQQGRIDMSDAYVGAYESVVPGVGCMMLAQLTPMEERKPGGAFDYLTELHKKYGIKYLGRPEGQEVNYFYTFLRSKKAMTKEEISKLRIGTAAGAKDAVAAWGCSPVNVAVPENYEALQSGIVDGIAGQPLQGAISNSWDALVKYVIDEPYYQSTVSLIMNYKLWSELPPDIQQAITEAVAEGEKEAVAARGAQEIEYKKHIMGHGVEFYKLPEDVAKWYLEQAYEGAWKTQTARFPEVASQLRKLLSK